MKWHIGQGEWANGGVHTYVGNLFVQQLIELIA